MKKGKFNIVLRIIKVLATVIAVIALAIVILQRVTNNKLKLFGYGVYTVISESMLPEYEIGDMFIAKEINQDSIKIGDDIVYIGQEDSYKDKVITHRVIRMEKDGTIVTKGINNPLEDPPITYNQVYGKVAHRLIVFSLFSKLMNNSILFYVLIFVPFTILIFLDIKEYLEDKKEEEEKKEQEKQKESENNNPAPVETVVQPNTEVVTQVPVVENKEENKVVEENKE